MKRLMLFLISATILLIFNTPSVSACSYGEIPPPTVDSMLARDVVVRGVVLRNNAGNSIIEVERYIKGSGARYLLLYRQSPSDYIRKAIRHYDFGCSYAVSPVADVGTRAYFALNRQDSGTYSITYFESESIFPIVDNEDGHFVRYWDSQEMFMSSEAEFEALMAERVGNPSTLPDENLPMPRFRTLMIRTESGQRYILPVDSNEIQTSDYSPCAANCRIASPDGSHYAVHIPNDTDTYWIWYFPNPDGRDWSQGFQAGDFVKHPPRVDADALLFSPNGDYLLTWYDGRISLYAFNTWQESGNNGLLPSLQEVWSAQLAVTETITADTFAGLAAWSGNSNAFAYWDADGLKWLDVGMMRVPRLIVQHESASIQPLLQTSADVGIPPLLELSATGRYLRYGDTSEWTLLDILSGTEYDDMLVSPDETEFVSVAPEVYPYASVSAEEGECLMFDLQGNCLMNHERPFDACILPMATCSSYVPFSSDYQLREAHWVGNSGLYYFACHNSDSNLCFVNYIDFASPFYYSHNLPDSYQTNAFAYDEYYGTMAWAVEDYRLRFDRSRFSEPLDFSDVLDSPIVSLEWGAPLWYQEGR